MSGAERRTDQASRTDRASRTVEASPGTVFTAFASRSALLQWLPPGGASGTMHLFDFRTGGRFAMTLHFAASSGAKGKTGENEDRVEATFGEILPDRKIVWNVRFSSPDPAYAGVMVMIWTFTPTDEGTCIRVEARNVPPGISAKDHAKGLKSSLDSLARYVELRSD